MRIAYADPPYLGQCRLYLHDHGDDGRCWDEIGTHARLVDRLGSFDGWALSLSSSSLRDILPLCPPDVRVAAWVKPWASWKPGVAPAYAWEPVIFRGHRKVSDDRKVRDYVAVKATTEAGFTGGKPMAFSAWLFALLGMEPDDELVDLFPGSGAVTEAWSRWRREPTLFGARA